MFGLGAVFTYEIIVLMIILLIFLMVSQPIKEGDNFAVDFFAKLIVAIILTLIVAFIASKFNLYHDFIMVWIIVFVIILLLQELHVINEKSISYLFIIATVMIAGSAYFWAKDQKKLEIFFEAQEYLQEEDYLSAYYSFNEFIETHSDHKRVDEAKEEIENLIPLLANSTDQTEQIIGEFAGEFCYNQSTEIPAYISYPNSDGDGVWICGHLWDYDDYEQIVAETPSDLKYFVLVEILEPVFLKKCGPYVPIGISITESSTLEFQAESLSLVLYSLEDGVEIDRITMTADDEVECPESVSFEPNETKAIVTKYVPVNTVIDWVESTLP